MRAVRRRPSLEVPVEEPRDPVQGALGLRRWIAGQILGVRLTFVDVQLGRDARPAQPLRPAPDLNAQRLLRRFAAASRSSTSGLSCHQKPVDSMNAMRSRWRAYHTFQSLRAGRMSGWT